jgi:hypothetical protein
LPAAVPVAEPAKAVGGGCFSGSSSGSPSGGDAVTVGPASVADALVSRDDRVESVNTPGPESSTPRLYCEKAARLLVGPVAATETTEL